MTVLESIDSEYDIPSSLLRKLTKTIKYQYNKNENERYEFLDSLPTKLKNDLMIILYEEIIAQQSFFKKQPHDFLLYVLPMLRFHRVEKGETLISVGDIVEEMYFVIKGCLSLTLGVHSNNLQVCKVKKGNHFGDLLMQLNENSPFELKCKKKSTDVLVLKKEDFLKIKNSFTNNIFEILENSLNQLKFVDKKFQLFHILSNHYKEPKLVKRKMIKLNNYLFEKGLDNFLEDQIDFEEPLEFIKSNGVNQVIEIIESYDYQIKKVFNKEKETKLKNTDGKFENKYTKMKINGYTENKQKCEWEYPKKHVKSKFYAVDILKAEDEEELEKEKECKYSGNGKNIIQKFSSKKSNKLKESFKTSLSKIHQTFNQTDMNFKILKDKEIKVKSGNLFEMKKKNKSSMTQRFSRIINSVNSRFSCDFKSGYNCSKSYNRRKNFSKSKLLKSINTSGFLKIEKPVDIHILNENKTDNKIQKNHFKVLKPVTVQRLHISNISGSGILSEYKKNKTYQMIEEEKNKEFLDQIEKFKDHFSIQTNTYNENNLLIQKSVKEEAEMYVNQVMCRFEMKIENEMLIKLDNLINKMKIFN